MHSGALIAGRYRLLDPIGSGSMGHVWHAQDERLHREVAVKIVDLAQASETVTVERFNSEVVAIARLNHPNVVTTFDAGVEDQLAYLVMELLHGESLAERLRRGPLPILAAARIGAEVGQALEAGHAVGVVHRDIKPGNVFLATTGAVKVLDFGIAESSGDGTDSPAALAVGTAAYMSPEQAMARRAGPASDVYSLGCLVYAMLCARPPFVGVTAVDVAQQHVNVAPVPLRQARPGVPSDLDSLVNAMLAKDVEARPSASDAAARLRRLASPTRSDADATAVLPAAGATAVLPAATAAATAVLPVVESAGPEATAVFPTLDAAPGATAVLPPTPPVQPLVTAPLPSSSQFPPVAPAMVRANQWTPPAASARPQFTAPPPGRPTVTTNRTPPGSPWFRRGVIGVLVAMLAVVLVGAAWLGLQKVASVVPTQPPATASPSKKATPTPTPTPKPTPTPTSKPTLVLPTMPTIQLPTMPPMPDPGRLALQGAVDTVSAALDSWSPETDAERAAKQQLTDSWATASDRILAGDKAKQALTQFSNQAKSLRNSKAISTADYATLTVALQAVGLLL